jgi:hypothetical protein
LEGVSKQTQTGVTVRVFQKPVNANLRFYKAIGGTDFLGDFVYVDGGFHYLDKQILLALSHSAPIRIKTGGTFQVPFLIAKFSLPGAC